MKKMKTFTMSLLFVPVFFYSIVVECRVSVVFPTTKPLLSEILKFIYQEKKSIVFAEFAFHHPAVISALSLKAKEGVKISGVIDQNSIEQIGKHILLKNKHAQNSTKLLRFLKKHEIDVFAGFGRAMHNKVMCFGRNSQTKGPVVISGSANCTVSGLDGVVEVGSQKSSSRNFENLLIIEGNKKIYSQYIQEINRIKKEVRRQRDKGSNNR